LGERHAEVVLAVGQVNSVGNTRTYLLYHDGEDGTRTLAADLPRALARPNLRASFVISIREDALAKLDRFKGRIPNVFGNYLRLEHLDRAAGREAIAGPIDRYNELVADGAVAIEPALVEDVLDQVATGKVELGQAGRGGGDRLLSVRSHLGACDGRQFARDWRACSARFGKPSSTWCGMKPALRR